MQADGEESCGLGIIVGVIKVCKPWNWDVRREIRPDDRKSVPLVDS